MIVDDCDNTIAIQSYSLVQGGICGVNQWEEVVRGLGDGNLPVGSRGNAPVGGLGNEVPQKLKHFGNMQIKF